MNTEVSWLNLISPDIRILKKFGQKISDDYVAFIISPQVRSYSYQIKGPVECAILLVVAALH